MTKWYTWFLFFSCHAPNFQYQQLNLVVHDSISIVCARKNINPSHPLPWLYQKVNVRGLAIGTQWILYSGNDLTVKTTSLHDYVCYIDLRTAMTDV